MKRFLLIASCVLAGAAAFVAYMGSERGMNSRIDRVLKRADSSLLTDGRLHVFLCGTAAALPDENRAGPCTAVIANGEFLLIDAGPASWRNVDLMDLPIGGLSAILVTHFHSDHIGEIGEAVTQSWIGGRRTPLDIYGPPGIGQVVEGFRLAYAQDVGYRVAHHGEEYLPRDGSRLVVHAFPLAEGDAAVPVFERNGLRVSAFRVEHAPADPAVGYRIEYAGRVVVVSGDTKKSAAVARHAQGADLLVHEALASQFTDRASRRARDTGFARFAKLASDVKGYHTTPVEAAQVAADANVRQLVITHVFPPLPNVVARKMFLSGMADVFKGKIVLGEDRMRFDLLPGRES